TSATTTITTTTPVTSTTTGIKRTAPGPYTPEELATLKELKQQGLDWPELVAQLNAKYGNNRTVMSVSRKWQQLQDLASAKASAAAKKTAATPPAPATPSSPIPTPTPTTTTTATTTTTTP